MEANVRHRMLTAFGDHPWPIVFPLLAVAALGGLPGLALERAGAEPEAPGDEGDDDDEGPEHRG